MSKINWDEVGAAMKVLQAQQWTEDDARQILRLSMELVIEGVRNDRPDCEGSALESYISDVVDEDLDAVSEALEEDTRRLRMARPNDPACNPEAH